MKWLMTAVAACALSAAAAQPSPNRGGQLRMAIQGEPRSQDPHTTTDEPSELLSYLTHGVLVRVNRATQQAEAELAESWKASSDGRTLTLALRKAIRFSDGTPFVPADVCYSLNRLLDPALDSPNGDALRGAAGKLSCTAAPSAVTLKFEKPLSSAERWLDGVAILSTSSPAREKAVLGPFSVQSWQAGSHLVLQRNPHYWKKDEAGRGLPYLDSIRLEIQRNRDIEAMRFERGELDLIANLSPEIFERLRTQGNGAALEVGASLDSEQIWFNQVSPSPVPEYKLEWFRSRAFRAAISQAIRRDDLARVVYRGHATPASGPVSPANLLWANRKVARVQPDAKASLALLRSAGFQLSGGVLRDRSGNPVEFTVVTNAGNRNRERMASLIQQDLLAVGIRARLVTLDFPSLIERITKSFDYEACLLGLVGADLDPNGQMNVWLSSAANHQWNPNQKSPATPWEAEIDQLMRQQASALDQSVRKRLWDRVQEIAAFQAPFVYLVHPNTLVAVSSRVAGVKPVVMQPHLLWNADRLSLRNQSAVSRVR